MIPKIGLSKMGDSFSKTEHELNNDYPNKYPEFLKNVEYWYNLYDVDTCELLTPSDLRYIYGSGIYFFHGTSYCRAVKILNDGFDDDIQFCANSVGPGIYLADNLNYSLWYGPCVLICTVKRGYSLHLPFKHSNQKHDLTKYDTVFQHGYIDRFDNRSKKDEGFFRYNELSVKDPNHIKIKYVLISKIAFNNDENKDKTERNEKIAFNNDENEDENERNEKRKDENERNEKRKLSCVLDLKAKNSYDKKNSSIEKIDEFIKNDLWYIKLDFRMVLEFLNLKLEDIMLEDGTIQPLLKNMTLYAVSSDLIHTLTNTYILAAKIKDKDANIIEVKPKTIINNINFDCILDPYAILYKIF